VITERGIGQVPSLVDLLNIVATLPRAPAPPYEARPDGDRATVGGIIILGGVFYSSTIVGHPSSSREGSQPQSRSECQDARWARSACSRHARAICPLKTQTRGRDARIIFTPCGGVPCHSRGRLTYAIAPG